MYVDDHKYTTKSGTYRRVLIRHSYRDQNGKTKQRMIANITGFRDEEIEAIKYALRNKDNIDFLRQISNSKTEYGKIAGPSILLRQVSNFLGINKVLGKETQSNYILWQIFARLIKPGSRLSNVRLAQTHCGCELLGIGSLTEYNLYDSLVWLHDRKEQVEKMLFKQTVAKESAASTIFLYDVSSSYFEGQCNELASYGYNRDKKKGKKQLVYGLLTDSQGNPLSIEAFRGNTKDPVTLKPQIKKIKDKFGCTNVVIVGDKGMIKSAQIEDIEKSGLHYITTITKPQIESLINKNVFQLELFNDKLVEVVDRDEKVRYVLRRNPARAEEMKLTRQSKIDSISRKLGKSNKYLEEHPRAKTEIQIRDITAYIKKLKMDKFTEPRVVEGERELRLHIDKDKLEEAGKLDGCYVIKSDIPDDKKINKEELHSHYKSLALVEWAFRTEKSQIEIRPVYLRKEHRTKAHLIVCMLAYKIEKYLRECWKELDMTVEEGMDKLCSIVELKTKIGPKKEVSWLAEPDEMCKKLLSLADVILPTYLPAHETIVSTNEKLPKHRK